MREEAASVYLLYNIAPTIVLLCGVIAYTVLIYQLGRQSSQPTYNLPYNGTEHHAVSTRETKAYSVLKQKASRIALDLWRFTDTLVNRTERSSLENIAVNLAARISAMDRVSGQAEQRRVSLVALSQRLLQQITRNQNPPYCVFGKPVSFKPV